ncbi:histidine phosphatase family protein [Marinicauda algicola]|uniref:phosphoglycerate mutase (2,3-diphosphoglycerate-dependent) n=1 Tax=Marinicauda algicola TaxID=2029849 RepID=A0A4S2H419_9PROT|nr:histidine phosphatase family protein [Marinicauda algicola]TGY90273.1 histidine phosphatase family protein [Marinicauda algicola]
MLLILARHGNTFGPEDTPVWVGAKEDLPLVEKGLEQSREIGRAIRDAGIVLDRILAGPLKRTRHGARLAAEKCGFTGEVEIDERLTEIDYGVWGGRSDAEIAEQWGEGAIEAWRERSVPPEGAGWSPSPNTIRANVKSVLASVTRDLSADQAVLILTSNGILRYFHERLAGENALPQDAKVKTGHMCAAEIVPGATRLKLWNAAPEAFSEAVAVG